MLRFSLEKGSPRHDETGRPWYDTKRGIARHLTSLEGLQTLVHERHAAGYRREERLNEFYLFGRYHLDTCGNCSRASGKAPKDVLPQIPDVMTHAEFWEYVKKHMGAHTSLSFVGDGGALPLPGLVCSYCKKPWDIGNCNDTVVVHSHEVFPISEFAGKTLGDVKTAYAEKNDAIYWMQSDILIRNDIHIDRSPKYPNPSADWQKGFVKNERGWLDEKSVTDTSIIAPGDEGFFNIWKYFHSACNRQHLNIHEEKAFRDVFEKAGFGTIKMTALPNGYCPCERCAPWFSVKTEVGTIVIGWRKRVINIDWSGTRLDAGDLFAGEQVTGDKTFIHAWGLEKAQEYLTRIRQKLSPAV